MEVKAKSYGVDLAHYQSADVGKYVRSGAKFVIVQLSEGTWFNAPTAGEQIRSAKRYGVAVLTYFFANFGSSVYQARREALHAVERAHQLGVVKGSYMAVDWESSDNTTSGYPAANTAAIIAAMEVIKKHGYRPLFYSYTGLFSRFNYLYIVSKFGRCLWLANYPYSGATYSAPMSWAPKYRGVLIWQFTDNFCGLNADGNISIHEFDSKGNSQGGDWEMSIHPVVRYDVKAVAVVKNPHFAYVYDSPKLDKATGKRKHKTSFIVYDVKDGAVKVGKRQYFDGRAVIVINNPIASNSAKAGTCKILKSTHAFKEPTSSSKKLKWLTIGTKLKFDKREGKWLHTPEGWVTGLRAYVIL